ncbi:hypothetical protein C8Q75DRAFT_894891 [Abortiporus biennis]|nr:hypothetical protein C8Q75DRAFT_894891 [Abortiporus biennis]
MAPLTGKLIYKPQLDISSIGFSKLHGLNLNEKMLWFDKQIETSVETYVAVTRLRNNCVPIGFVSDEILLRIFIFACSSLRDCARTSTSISQVCYHWRALALQTPQLWITLDVSAYPKFALRVQLPRAKDLPINLIYQHKRPNPLKNSDNAIHNFNREAREDIREKLPTCIQIVALYFKHRRR